MPTVYICVYIHMYMSLRMYGPSMSLYLSLSKAAVGRECFGCGVCGVSGLRARLGGEGFGTTKPRTPDLHISDWPLPVCPLLLYLCIYIYIYIYITYKYISNPLCIYDPSISLYLSLSMAAVGRKDRGSSDVAAHKEHPGAS